MLGVYAKRVFCIIERVVERIAGPICFILSPSFMIIGTFCFFDVIAPSLPKISIPLCLLVLLNLCMNYFYAITISPGFIDKPPPPPPLDYGKRSMVVHGASSWSEKGINITPASLNECQKCKKVRPERAHHCRQCNKCVLKYDHHCPCKSSGILWINQCVGLHNERHFVLFVTYVFVATAVVVRFGFPHFIHACLSALGMSNRRWNHHVTEYFFYHAYLLGVVLCFSSVSFLIITLRGIIYGETAGESRGNDEYRKQAKARNEEFVNTYDCGKLNNFLLFFNIEDEYSALALFLPIRLNPYTDGYSWARKDGYDEYPGFCEASIPFREKMSTKMYKGISFVMTLYFVFYLFFAP